MRPAPGTVSLVRLPGGPGIRVDGGIAMGSVVPPHYDSLLLKLVAHGADRAEALARMRSALDEIRIEGISTNVALHRALLADRDVIAGQIHTRFLSEWLERNIPAAARAS
jgi:acetyl-CoA carboxylase biotin carboxylase subunit